MKQVFEILATVVFDFGHELKECVSALFVTFIDRETESCIVRNLFTFVCVTRNQILGVMDYLKIFGVDFLKVFEDILQFIVVLIGEFSIQETGWFVENVIVGFWIENISFL